ncbi:MAG TPA: hypothetical protein VLW50_00525 [Streptosporangiaceae bacterium]|nr:hypothetical protein [Streptosporangiaceae bacterium]
MNGRFDSQDEFDGQDERRTGAGFVLVSVSCVVAVILLILAIAYLHGGSARIATAYTAMAAPADQALTAEVAAYTHNQRHALAAAKSDLMKEVKTENAFDDQAGDFTFPNAADAAGDALLKADAKRVKLLTLQAGSTSLQQLQSFDASDQAADAAVAAQVRVIRQDLGLPPVSAQLY